MSRELERRALLGRALAFGAAGLLTGCDYDNLQHPDLADRFLRAMSSWNDRVQAALFNPHTLAPTFPASAITPRRASTPITTATRCGWSMAPPGSWNSRGW